MTLRIPRLEKLHPNHQLLLANSRDDYTNAPSTSYSPSSSVVQPPILHQGIAVGPTIEDNPLAQADNDPFVNMFAPKPSSDESSSGDVSTRKQLATDALWCLYISILSKVEPKNVKTDMDEACGSVGVGGCGGVGVMVWQRGEVVMVLMVVAAEAAGGGKRRVEESGCGDRIDTVMRSVFGVGRKSCRKGFRWPVGGDGGGRPVVERLPEFWGGR
ncbi:hypothetical protein Tco_0445134 [Tanacetum coccineum]